VYTAVIEPGPSQVPARSRSAGSEANTVGV